MVTSLMSEHALHHDALQPTFACSTSVSAAYSSHIAQAIRGAKLSPVAQRVESRALSSLGSTPAARR
eukprot:IDg20019t1